MKYYILSRTIHRLLVLVISFTTLIMGVTGVVMKFPKIANIFPFIDLGMVRFLHNSLSPIYGILLVVMMITGLLLYFLPHIKHS